MMEQPIWWEYAVFDEDGYVKGIKEDSPDNVKKEYEEYLKTLEKGIKI